MNDDILIKKSKKFVNAYFKQKDFKKTEEMFIDKGSWLCSSNDIIAYTPEQFASYFKNTTINNHHHKISFQDCQILYNDQEIGIVYCKYLIHCTDNENIPVIDQRITIIYKLIADNWKILNINISLPNDFVNQNDLPSKTDYLKLQHALKEKTEQIEMIIRTTAGGMKGSLDDDYYTFFYVNEELCKMLGYSYDEFMEMSGGTAVGAVYPPDLQQALADCQRCFAKGPEYKTEYRIKKKDGSLLWVMDSGRKVLDENGQTVINSIITDISELKEAVNQLKIDQERYEIVAQLSDDIIFEYDVNNDLLEYQQPHIDAPIKIIKKDFFNNLNNSLFIHPDDLDNFKDDFMMLLSSQVTYKLYKLEYRLALTPDNYSWYRLLLRRIFDNEDHLIKIIGKIINISSELKLKHQSITDPLTGAYNRLFITSAIQEYCQSIKNDLAYACILIDVDHFKTINDTYGHITGDRFLVEMTDLIKGFFRASDLIARIGGDEFFIFIKDIYDKEIVREKADALIKLFHKYVYQNNYPSKVTISMGIYISDQSNITFSELYNKVDIALYHAKSNGRDRYVYYHEGMVYPK